MLTQIEDRLKQCNGDIFANICRQYLSYEYKSILASGFVLGKEKSKKGTPDNFIPYNDYYVFNEVTTVEKDLIKKLEKDINHCFVQKDIPIEKISKIVLICNSKIDPKYYHRLSEFKNTYDKDTRLEVIGIDDLATRIYRDYHSIIRQLGIPIDTGQILELEEFLNIYEKSKFSTTLSNKFFNRKEELKEGIETLLNYDVLLLEGKAGVGKTKLSLELTKLFIEKNPDYQIKYIINNANLDIWEDLKVQFLNNKNYLIVIDDANKLRSNLELIVNFINREKREGKIKLLLTVRNYVKSEVEDKIGKASIIKLNNFTREELANILQSDEFNISKFYVDKIFNVSKGNPRLAIMAAKAGIKDVKKLDNAYFIHEEYFSSQGDLSSFQNINFFKASGILALLKNIDFENRKLITKIEEHFQISKKSLIENLQKLYIYEVSDEFEGIYKISDQILAEYLFFETFIKKRIISFQYLLQISAKDTSFNLSNLLTPIVNNYGFEYVKDFILSDLINVNSQLKSHEKKIKFYKEFWYYLPSECLLYIKKYIHGIVKNESDEFEFKVFKDSHTDSYEDEVIDILLNFKHYSDYFGLSVNLCLEYGFKNQLNFSKLLKILTQGYFYNYSSQEINYYNQIELFNILYKKANENKKYKKIILFIAHKYLTSSYQITRNRNKGIEIGQIVVKASNEQLEFRKNLFNFIFTCFSQGYKEETYSFFYRYLSDFGFDINEDLINHDKDLVLEFFINNFSKSSYQECNIVDLFISNLDRYNITYPKDFNKQFISEEFFIYLKLSYEKLKLKDFEGDYEKYDRFKKNEIENFIKNYSLEDFKLLFKKIDFIYRQKKSNSYGYSMLGESIIAILKYLSDNYFDMFIDIINESFKYEFSDKLRYGRLFSIINLKQNKGEVLVNCLSKSFRGNDYLRSFWLESKNYNLKENDIELFHTSLFDKEDFSFWRVHEIIDKIDSRLVNKKRLVNDLLNFIIQNQNRLQTKDVDSEFFLYIFEKFPLIFKHRIKEIKGLYLILSKMTKYFDLERRLLQLIISMYPNYVSSFLSKQMKDKKWFSREDLSNLKLHKLWEIDKYEKVFEKILVFLIQREDGFWSNTSNKLEVLFQESSTKKLYFLKHFLNNTNNDNEIISVFNIVVSKFNTHKLEFLQIILDKNIHFSVFRKLEFYVLTRVYSGSRIPRIRYAISENEIILNYLKNLDEIKYLEHINFMEKEIFYSKLSIERERKREFIESMGW
ncbi:conserved hypothetical protein [Tenacibaculum sp. 190524A02b]|uniref:Novel STAND NTPase 3 domain-containing protein n=1 Tax=Tenacibaculum vairaonense TaxID=3137860 RepID=A0ABM9PIQ1_9FLAO